MNRDRLKAFLKTPKGKLITVLIAFGFSQIFLLNWLFGGIITDLPDHAKIVAAQKELLRARETFQAVEKTVKEHDNLRQQYRKIALLGWNQDKHGMVETALRQQIAGAATKLDLKLNTIGSVRLSRINRDFYFAELDISGNTTLEEFAKLLGAIQELTPQPQWRRLDLRPDNRPRQGQNQGAGSANLASRNDPANIVTRVFFNGSIRVIGYDGPKLPETRRIQP